MTPRRPSADRTHFDLQRAVDLMVFAPIGLGAAIVEDGPDAIRRARLELRNARFLGQIAVDRGVAELRRRLDGVADPGERDVDVIDVDVIDEADTAAAPQTSTITAGELALPDYDTLPAIDIVDKLEHLTPGERDAIRSYEDANRQRRTVLGKLDQLGAA